MHVRIVSIRKFVNVNSNNCTDQSFLKVVFCSSLFYRIKNIFNRKSATYWLRYLQEVSYAYIYLYNARKYIITFASVLVNNDLNSYYT